MTVIDDRAGLQTDTSTFGTRMKRYRTMAKLSIAKLADYLKREYGELALSENVLTNIELGRKTDISVDATIHSPRIAYHPARPHLRFGGAVPPKRQPDIRHENKIRHLQYLSVGDDCLRQS